jgi:hypothetical protein
MASKRRLLLAALFLLAGAVACENNNTASLQDKITQRDETIRSLETEKAQIVQRCTRLERRLDELRTEHENLKARHETLSRWSRELAQRFGPSLWYFGTDEKPLPIKPLHQAGPEQLLTELNRRFEASGLPRVELVDVEDHVAHVRIREALKLTQEMGTTGATAYLQSVIYTLTSIPGIDYVDFDFPPGAHAIPGRYSR